MNRYIARRLLAVGLVLVCAAPLSASIQVGDQIKFGNGVGSPGGIFNINNLNVPGTTVDFQTFCVEITEFVNFTSTYVVQKIGTVTERGGKTLSSYTAWLYTSFVNGALENFDATSPSDANTLQLAFWKSVGYSDADIVKYIGGSWFNMYDPQLSLKPWLADYNDDASWDKNGVGNVRILNLRKLNSNGTFGDYAQDQLVMVPETASFVVWGLLIACGTIVAGRREPHAR